MSFNCKMGEGWLLQLVSLLQHWRTGEAAAILSDWLPPAVMHMAILPAQGFSDALLAAGLSLPFDHGHGLAARLGQSAYADRGLHLVQ